MKSLLRLSLVLAALLAAAAVEAKSPVKKFSGDGFKIVQFTDLHWVSKKREINDSTLALMDKVIRDEKPDLAVLTGDIVTWNSVPDAVAAWKEIMAFLDERDLDFVVGFGNHDPENGTLTKKEIMDLLKESQHNLTFNDDKSLPGQGNCYLQVKDQAGRNVLWNLYFFDSHDYNRDKKISGHYGWIEFDQVAWYRRLSDRLNKGKETRTPALAFFHIPLPEYVPADSASVYGSIKDFGRGAPELNSGLFHSFVEKNDVFGTFCGHDHNDDYTLVYDGICMCYGRKTGFNPAYKEVLPRGARIIVLHPDKPSFDTYIIDQEGRCLDYSFTKTR